VPTDDQQVLVTGQAAAPAGFLVPGNGQIKPKAMNAVFDGSGAAGAFLPTLEIVSDAGIVVARCPAPSVAAGGSAEVSWFPRLAASAASPAGATSLSYAYINATNLTPASGENLVALDLPAGGFKTSDASLFAYALFSGVHGIHVLTAGTYLVVAGGWFDSGNATTAQFAQMDLTTSGRFTNELALCPYVNFGGGDWEASTLFATLWQGGGAAINGPNMLLLQACESSTGGANLDAGLQVIAISTVVA